MIETATSAKPPGMCGLKRPDSRHIPQIQMRCFENGIRGIQKNSNHVRDLAPTTLAAIGTEGLIGD